MSGGGLHLYWYLTEPEFEAAVVERANKVLEGIFAGDNVGDMTRIMRLPGSTNTKRMPALVEVLWDYHWERHNLEELVAKAKKSAVVIEPQTSSEAPTDPYDGYDRLFRPGAGFTRMSVEELWETRVRYGAPKGFLGIHAAKLITTARMHINGYGEKHEKEVVRALRELVVTRIKKDATEELSSWNMTAEDDDTRQMFRSWIPRWVAIKRQSRKAKASHATTKKKQPSPMS
jgi:hypothetical protein